MEPQKPDPDVERMLAFCAGDVAAFDQLFERWAGPLLRYLERMVGDTGTAEELVQESFFRVHRARSRYEPRARFSTFLYRIATNLALNELKRPRRRHPHTGEGDVVLEAAAASTDRLVEQRRAHSDLIGALDRLPERQRMALWLSAAEGHSYKEVADALDTTEKSVKSLVHRARAALGASKPSKPTAAVSRHDEEGAVRAPGGSSRRTRKDPMKGGST
jgi:RNA polymerase sigma-70 factor (ECF subfamily)